MFAIKPVWLVVSSVQVGPAREKSVLIEFSDLH